MYNYSLNLKYKDLEDEEASNTQYRKELLAVFSLQEYTSDMIHNQDILFDSVKTHYNDIFKCIKENDSLALIGSIDDKSAFMVLFSWEYFHDNHKLLKAILSKHHDDNITMLKYNLINKIIEYNKK